MSETFRLKRGSDMFKVPFEMIICEPTKNGRIDYGNIEELAFSIFENGQKQPIRATKTGGNTEATCRFILRDGFRRYLAIRHIREVLKKDFPYILVIGTGTKYTENDALYEQIVSNEAKPFNMLEEGNVYTALKSQGEKEAAIAKKVGKSVQHIYNCLSLAGLPPELKQFVINESVSPTLMLELSKEYNDWDELINVINTRLQDKIERTDKRQSVLPFETGDGSIDIETPYDIPKKTCKLTARDFEPSENEVDKDAKEKPKGKDYSFLDTDDMPERNKDKDDGNEMIESPIVRLETVKNMLIAKNISTQQATSFIDAIELALNDGSAEEIFEIFN